MINQEPENEAVQTTRGFNAIFIHSSLDDAGLTPQQFRVFGHIARRGGEKTSWAGNKSMAATCRMNEETLVEALKELERRKMLVRQERPGKTTLWRITPPDNWILEVDRPTTSSRPKVRETPRLQIPPGFKGVGTPRLQGGGYPPASRGDEGNPLKGIPERNGASAPSRVFSDGWLVAFKMKHGFDYDYKKADGIAADRLLKKGVAPDELLSTAIKAWSQTDDKKFWSCVKLSHSVPKFCGAFNDIRSELRNLPSGRKLPPGSRIINGVEVRHIPSGNP